MRLIGIVLSAIAGAAMSIQGVMNARLGERIGLLESNAFVQGTAFLLSAFAVLLFGKGSFAALQGVEKIYLFGGALGLVITLTVMVGMQTLGPTVAVCVILVAQLVTAALLDAFGLLGTQKTPFHLFQFAGVALMIAGVVVFKRSS